MLKKAALAVFGLVLALSFSAPKAQAEVHVAVALGTPAVYGAVAVQPVHYGADDCPPYAAYGYDNPYAYGNYGYGNYGYDNYAYGTPYTTYSYYDSGRYYYAPAYGGYNRDYWRHRHDREHEKLEREHQRWHERHEGDRW